MLIKANRISTDMFFYDKEDKTFSQEISSLGRKFNTGRIYDDACDEGFTLVSHKTGKEEVMVLMEVDTDEGDIMGWWFAPVNPKMKFRLLVIND